jgi:hypothetical protein
MSIVDREVSIPDLQKRRVCSAEEIRKVIDLGAKKRKTAANNMHDASSRSHA